jgi:hypothetical protein
MVGASQGDAKETGQPSARRPETTLAIFPDPKGKPMPEELWQALVAAIRAELNSNRPEIRAIADPRSLLETQILRGDKIAPGLEVADPIPVFLHGDCETAPRPHFSAWDQPERSDALGWVIETHGHIEPFIHVDCKRIGQMLWTRGNFCDRNQRDRLMAEAVARVILHEWIHIATQNPGHSSHGLSKANFGINDLATPTPSPCAYASN